MALQPLVQPVAQGAAVWQQVFGALQQRVRAGLQQRTLAGRQQLRASAEAPTLNTTATAAAAAKPNIRLILNSLKFLDRDTKLATDPRCANPPQQPCP